MGTLDPAHCNAFLASAYQVGQDRIIGGMHYPYDVLESRVLAEELFRELLQDKAFITDLESLRRDEWSKKTAGE